MMRPTKAAFAKTVGARILRLRRDRGLSQAALEKICGFAPTTISHFESGRRTPGGYNVAVLSRALGVEPCQIIDMPPSPVDPPQINDMT